MKGLLFFALLLTLELNLGKLCLENNIDENKFPKKQNNTIYCFVAKHAPEDDGPSKIPNIPKPMTNTYISGATGTTGPTASETISPSSEV